MAVESQPGQPVPPTSDPASNDGSGASKQLRRACDCCRKRKVKCDGEEPCNPCKKASIRCAYLQPPKKKGPKGLRSARVLHALRRIDDDAALQSPTSPTSPNGHGPFGNWQWSAGSPTSQYQSHHQHTRLPDAAYGVHPSVAPDQHPYCQHVPTAMPQQQPLPQALPTFKREPTQQSSWTSYPAQSVASNSPTGNGSIPQMLSPTTSEVYHGRALSGETLLPYVDLFFKHMYIIMPVIDRTVYLDPAFYTNTSCLSRDVYCFLCSLCAATIVQLDDSIPQPPSPHPTKKADHLFAEECLRERRTFDYVESMSTLSIMTSFFLFAYYGNHEKHLQAWHYLQESITFSENLNMDDELSYEKLNPVEGQWRRRLYWLLFITERAYAVQRRKHTRLHASVTLPAVFESEDPQLLNGFVNLANLFSAVDDSFVSAWRGSRRASLNDEAWLARTQKQLDATADSIGTAELTETQHLDISITREWLHVLAWQMGVSNGLIWGQGEGGMRLDYPVELARKVVEITSKASAMALDSHGIGMEQKLSDIAGCLADVLKCTAGDSSATFLEGKQYLNILLNKLSSMRGKESRYLKPLMAKMEGLIDYEVNNVTLPLPNQPAPLFSEANTQQIPTIFAPSSPRWSMTDSVSMLRTLSMCGTLGIPGIAVPEEWDQRRPSGRMLENSELEVLQPWLAQGTA
ncbi:putative sucrose utilization protein SUC1 [Fulvia fulva]|uniref:Sucrose utilization protein SUC1 n=1 Tax=Passalora fulva TaxID=5499 RepID=A0A9Q8LAJ0_PASFU|nr:putative sucrose utilization protein SUC1 [Fulvia fulva]KAK4631082.1 putative sucrose utilization protein SUC1 [Fulvia fulva]UJO13827.1 putative sucrose utilization protein SUC1 [Fulvia fulva]WPV11944.1 putative sucrose utilization protein SUC1 [Fulvia fulva]WPV26776.1 putative sucrose utilization protein SUC1 [Fulvia fulva]